MYARPYRDIVYPDLRVLLLPAFGTVRFTLFVPIGVYQYDGYLAANVVISQNFIATIGEFHETCQRGQEWSVCMIAFLNRRLNN